MRVLFPVGLLALGLGVWAAAQEPTGEPTPEATASPIESPSPTPTPYWFPPGAFELVEHDEPLLYPCMDCHADEVANPTRRELTDMHDDVVLKHGPPSRWCLDCHDLNDRDKLKLASGEHVEFVESTRLCAQCHGEQLDDWRLGVHGKVTGNIFDTRIYRTCVECHDPHQPKFKARKPLPAPVRPADIQPKNERSDDVPPNDEPSDESENHD